MKKNIFKFLIFTVLITSVGCNKRLDVTPAQSIDQAVALKTSADVQVALVGSYTQLGNINLYGGRMFVISELLADNNELIWSGTFQGLTQMFNKSVPINNGFVASTWLAGYTAINTANNVISAIGVVDAANKNKYEGEAKFLRAAAYFELVKLYAKDWSNGNPATNDGVPLVLTPTREITEADKVPRAKVAAVYTQIIADLTDAEAKLPVSNGFFATKNAAAALLARVYLQKRDYANARDAANRVITSNRYVLAGTYAEAFPYNGGNPFGNTTEDIFAMQVTTNSGVNDFQTFFSADGRGDITITNEHLNLYEANDERLDLFYVSGGSVYNGKNDNVYGNVHTIRLAEMYLIRAESNFRLSTAVGATPLSDINRIRNRVNLGSKLTLTLDEILLERKLELAFEGFNLSDIKRLGIVTGYFTGGGGLPATSTKLVLPIPEREIRVNPNLTQNEGYF
jgi:starch-binding outer membrane protein, SusD/RagB family